MISDLEYNRHMRKKLGLGAGVGAEAGVGVGLGGGMSLADVNGVEKNRYILPTENDDGKSLSDKASLYYKVRHEGMGWGLV